MRVGVGWDVVMWGLRCSGVVGDGGVGLVGMGWRGLVNISCSG